MQFKVHPFRRRGRRLSWREVRNSSAYSGDLITHIREVNRELIMVATLLNAEAPSTSALLPDLYQPVSAWVTPLAMRLRGFEQREIAKGGFSVVQEWHCEMP